MEIDVLCIESGSLKPAKMILARLNDWSAFDSKGNFFSSTDVTQWHSAVVKPLDSRSFSGTFITFETVLSSPSLNLKFSKSASWIYQLAPLLEHSDFATARFHIRKNKEEWKEGEDKYEGRKKSHPRGACLFRETVVQWNSTKTARCKLFRVSSTGRGASPEHQAFTLFYSSDIENGRRLIRFHSRTRLTNATGVEVAIQLRHRDRPVRIKTGPGTNTNTKTSQDGSRDASASTVWSVLPPDGSVHLPLQIELFAIAREVELAFRPVSSRFQWSRPPIRLFELAEAKLSVQCPMDGSRSTWNTRLSGTSRNGDSPAGFKEVRLAPCMAIQNTLPDPLDVRCGSHGLREFSVSPGETHPVFFLDPSRGFRAQFRYLSIALTFTDPVTFPPGVVSFEGGEGNGEGTRRRRHYVAHPTDKGMMLRLTIDIIVTKTRLLVVLSVPLWVIDASGLGLMLSETKGECCPVRSSAFRHTSRLAEAMKSRGEELASVELFSFFSAYSKKKSRCIYLRAVPDLERKRRGSEETNPSVSGSSVLARSPREVVADADSLSTLESALSKQGLYEFRFGERLHCLYDCDTPFLETGNNTPTQHTQNLPAKKIVGAVFVTNRAFVHIARSRLKARVRIADVREASPQTHPARLQLSLKDGSEQTFKIASTAALYFSARITRIMNLSLHPNLAQPRNSGWSWDPIYGDIAGSSGVVVMKSQERLPRSKFKGQYDVSYHISKHLGNWVGTNVLTIRPRYSVANLTPYVMEVMQCGTDPAGDGFKLQPDQTAPFYWVTDDRPQIIRFRCYIAEDGIPEPWSTFFDIGKVCERFLGLFNPRVMQRRYAKIEIRTRKCSNFVFISLVRVETTRGGSTTNVIGKVLPYRIENRCTREVFSVRQKCEGWTQRKWLGLYPLTHKPYALDDLLADPVLAVKLEESFSDSVADGKRKVDLDLALRAQGKYKTMRLRPRWHNLDPYTVFMYVDHTGPIKVICISEDPPSEPPFSPFGLKPIAETQESILAGRIASLVRSGEELLMKESELRAYVTQLGNVNKLLDQGKMRLMRRPKGIPSHQSMLQILFCGNSVQSRQTRWIRCVVHFGSKIQEVTLPRHQSREVPVVRFPVDPDFCRLTTICRIIIIESVGFRDGTCVGMVEFQLKDLSSHKEKLIDFDIVPCEKRQQRATRLTRPRWITPPCLITSQHKPGKLRLQLWWVPPKDVGPIQKSIAICKELRSHRKRVANLLRPKFYLSRQMFRVVEGEEKAALRKNLGRADALRLSQTMMTAEIRQYRIRVCSVRFGSGFDCFKAGCRLRCTIEVLATGQTYSIMVFEENQMPSTNAATASCQGGTKFFVFDVPSTFLLNKSRATVSLHSFVEKRRDVRHQVGFETVDSRTARISLLRATKHGHTSWLRMAKVGGRGGTTNSTNAESSIEIQIFCQKMPLAERITPGSSSLRLGVERIGALLSDGPKELLYVSVSTLNIQHQDSKEKEMLSASVLRIQVDSQERKARFPVVFHSTPLEGAEGRNFLHASLNRSKLRPDVSDFAVTSTTANLPVRLQFRVHTLGGPDGKVTFQELLNPCEGVKGRQRLLRRNNLVFPYMSVLVQAFTLNLDELLLYNLIPFVNAVQDLADALNHTKSMGYTGTGKDSDERERQIKSFVRRIDAIDSPLAGEQDVIIGLLHLHSILLTLNVEMYPGLRKERRKLGMNQAVNLFASLVGSIRDAKITLNEVKQWNMYLTAYGIIEALKQSYSSNLMDKGLPILFGMEAIGSPGNLLEGMADGFVSFFREPMKGVVEDPGFAGFGKGFAKGSKEFLGKTVFSIFGTAGKVTGSLSKNLAMLSMDKKFIEKTQVSHHKEKKHIGEGLLHGAESIGRGIFGGLSGLVMNPIEGAKKSGAKGFFEGMGKGLLGVVSKPTAGVAAAASGTFQSVENTAKLVLRQKSETKVRRVRSPLGRS